MRFNSNFGAAALGVLIVSAALPALAAGKHFSRMEKVNVAVAGVVVTGPAWATRAKI